MSMGALEGEGSETKDSAAEEEAEEEVREVEDTDTEPLVETAVPTSRSRKVRMNSSLNEHIMLFLKYRTYRKRGEDDPDKHRSCPTAKNAAQMRFHEHTLECCDGAVPWRFPSTVQ